MKIGIIGGGSAGLAAAIAAARKGAKVTILERNDKVGKKILVTGNGKCNLTNTLLSSEYYYSKDKGFIDRAFSRFGLSDTLSFFNGLGLLLTEKRGGIYPHSEQASAVLDALRFEVLSLGVDIKEGCFVKDIEACKGGYNVYFDRSLEDTFKSDKCFFDRVILTTGGKAAPKTGSDGSGLKIAQKMGEKISDLYPALGGVKCEGDFWKSISGVRCYAAFKIIGDTTGEGQSVGELQLTDYGISGIPVFCISRLIAEKIHKCGKAEIEVDLFADADDETLLREISSRLLVLNDRSYEQILGGFLNKKLSIFILKKCNIRPSDAFSDDPEIIKRIVKTIKHLRVFATGVNGFEQAQTTAGGILLSEVSDDFESLRNKGLFYAGEILDVDGICGGYNLQWAWSSGHIAGEAAAKC